MKRVVKRTNLFLVELVLNLFIFALCAAVCVGLLIHARSMSYQSTDLTQAVYLAQSIAEMWKADGAIPMDQAEAGGLLCSITEHDGVLDITIEKSGQPIYTLEGVRRIE